MNAPDMQRIRMSLPYYQKFGWEVEVLTVDEKFIEGYKDPLLNETIPQGIKIHKTSAWPVKWTRKIGLGSLSIRCLFPFRKKGNQILKSSKFDLVFFSTTMFHVCALGRYWKKKFGVPFIVDFQDPWRNDFYLSKPKNERPPKFKIAYLLNKWLEAYAMPRADGLIAVSKGYIESLQQRYPVLVKVPYSIIPFGCSVKDFEIANKVHLQHAVLDKMKINVIYIGAITPFFIPLIKVFFLAFKQSVANSHDYLFQFIGTNYSSSSQRKMIADLAEELQIVNIVKELPDRIPYFEAIKTMQSADILFVPGSKDVDYNASKIYNCILAKRPIFSVFNKKSEVTQTISNTNAGIVVPINGDESEAELITAIAAKMNDFKQLHLRNIGLDFSSIYKYTAEARTLEQVKLFDLAVA